jgi:hypothetical protein
VNNSYRNVVINRTVIGRPLNYGALNRYDDIHRTTNFNNFRGNNRVVNRPPPPAVHLTVPNKIITRNFDTTDRRINDYRGHLPQPPAQVHVPVTQGFTPVQGGFDPRVASHRGQISRALVPPPSRPPTHQVKPKDRNKH